MCRCWKKNIDYLSWLVVWNHGILWFSIQLEISENPNWRFVHDFSELNPPTSITTVKKKRLGHQSHTSMVGEIIYGQPPDWPDAKWNTTIQKKQPKISQVPKYLVKLHHKLSGGKNSTPPARPKSAKLHGCRASCHGTGVAVRNCHSISDLPSKCPQVLIWVCLKVGKPVISWLK